MMKKTLSLLLALAMLAALFGCGGKSGQQQEELRVKDATELLSTVWNSYSEDEKFPVSGGDMENGNFEGPGAFQTDDGEVLDSVLGLPQDMVDKVDGAASLMHMMNANTFTCGAFHVKSSADVETVANALRENILRRQWMCGFPDKLVILRAGDYVISFFGKETPVDTFKTRTLEAFSAASVVCDEPIG